MQIITDEVVLNLDGFLGVDPSKSIRARAEDFISSRSWITDQMIYGDQYEPADPYGGDTPPEPGEDVELIPRWSIHFNLGLGHIEHDADWFSDVRALIDFLDTLQQEMGTEFLVEVRYKSKLWYSEAITHVDGRSHNWATIKEMIECVTKCGPSHACHD